MRVKPMIRALLMAACVALPGAAAAQLTTGTIAGTVVDATGAALPGATITLSSVGVIGGSQVVVTDEKGAYQFTRLVPGSYGVKAEQVQHFTGFPEAPTVLVTSATVALTQVTQSLRAEPTGSSRLPSVNMADLRISKVVRAPRGFEVEPALDVFNLTNANPIQARVVQLGPTFDRATDILRGRLFRLGFYLRF